MTLLMCISSPTYSTIPLGNSFHLPSSAFPWRVPDHCFQQASHSYPRGNGPLRSSWAAPTRLSTCSQPRLLSVGLAPVSLITVFKRTHQKMIDWNTGTPIRWMRLGVMAPRYLPCPWPVQNKRTKKSREQVQRWGEGWSDKCGCLSN